MKNLKLFPFQRNRYFYGKFLSVDDFELEQRYMNDKRRMLNRFLYGTGVVCGMQVVGLDDYTISIEKGLALDFSGREIVVAEPVTKRLSSIQGYADCKRDAEMKQDVFLCIAYDEHAEGAVHNIARVSDSQEEEFNKYVEGYHLFLTCEEPEQEGEQITALYEQTKTIFYGEGIRIRQKVPRYVQSDTEAEITVFVEKKDQARKIFFSYQLRFACLEHEGKNTVTITFDEANMISEDVYTMKIPIRAKDVASADGYVEAVPDSFLMTIGEDTKREVMRWKFPVSVTEKQLPEVILAEYYNSSMEEIIKDIYNEAVYLAKMRILYAGDTYVIEKIENLPYRQYVWNHSVEAALETIRLRQAPNPVLPVRIDYDNGEMEQNAFRTKTDRDFMISESSIKAGSVVIELGIGGTAGQRFYSEEIVHGLGLGEVYIFLGLAKGIQAGSSLICGSQNVFEERVIPRIEMAAKVNVERGSFVVGIRCVEQVEAKRIRIFWTALKDKANETQKDEPEIMQIQPDIANLLIREKYNFEAVVNGKVQKHVKWYVKDEKGGSIDGNGCYTAPNQPGVYEIFAENMENNRLQAAAFVIVREEA